jgi:putative inorganic carbon (HCO3(-)) transporter
LVPPPFLRKLSLGLSIAAAVSILLSIAVSQILLALALGVLLLSGLPLRWPKIAIPLGLFLVWSLIALAFSPDPAYGLSQERKIFVFMTLLTIFSTVRTIAEAKWLVYAWMLVGTGTAAQGLSQWIRDVANADVTNKDVYHYYLGDRIRGFMGHWMTFSGQEMFVLLILAAWILFGRFERKALWIWLPCLLITATALELSQTRSVWAGALVAAVYLLWMWNRWSTLAVPVLLGVAFLAAPPAVRTRVHSISNPEAQTDSNEHRRICRLVGYRMIEAHPLFGVGPDEIRKQSVFFAYLPASVKQPLPEGYYGHLHNVYIQYAAERGIPATLFLVAALLLAMRDFWRALRKLPPGRSAQRFLLHAAIACILGIMVEGVFEYNLNDTEVLTMFLAIMSLGYLAVGSVGEEGRSAGIV